MGASGVEGSPNYANACDVRANVSWSLSLATQGQMTFERAVAHESHRSKKSRIPLSSSELSAIHLSLRIQPPRSHKIPCRKRLNTLLHRHHSRRQIPPAPNQPNVPLKCSNNSYTKILETCTYFVSRPTAVFLRKENKPARSHLLKRCLPRTRGLDNNQGHRERCPSNH